MVWKANEDLNEDKKQEGEEANATQGQILSSPGAVGGSSGQAATGTAAKDKTSSGSFTNLQSYIGANTGADKAMVGRVGNTVTNAQNTATGAGNTLEGRATDLISAGTVTDDIGATTAFKNVTVAPKAPEPAPITRTETVPATIPTTPKIGRAPAVANTEPVTTPTTPGTGRAPQDSSAPVNAPAPLPEGVKSVNDFTVDDIKPLWDAKFTGPNSWNDTPLTTEADAASAAYKKVADYGVNAGGDVEDRGVLLDDTFAKSGQQYGKGERILDSFLLGAGSEAGTLQGIADSANHHGAEFEAIKRWIGDKDTEGSLVSEGIKTTDKTRTDIREAGTGAQALLESEFNSITEAGGSLEQKIKTEEAIITAAINKDPNALKKAGLSDKAITALINEKELTPEKVKNLLNGSVDYKLGDVANELDVGNYSQLMKLLTGSDKEIVQGFKDFEKGKGTQLTAKDGTNEALEGLSNIQINEADIAKKNADIKVKQDRVRTILSKIGHTGYNGAGVTPAELTEAADLLGIDVERLIAANERGDALNLDELLKESSKLTLGNVTSPQQQNEFRKILATLAMGDKNFDPTAGGPTSSVDLAAADFHDRPYDTPKMDYTSGQIALETSEDKIYAPLSNEGPPPTKEEEAMTAALEAMSRNPGTVLVNTNEEDK